MFVIWGALHGIAMVIHRIWKDLGLRMWGWVGWLLTFNFINITWVFFRAKDWESALKVLGGMVGLGGVVLPDRLADKLGFLSEYGMEFGAWLGGIEGSTKTPFLIVITLMFVFIARNTTYYIHNFTATRLNAITTGIILFISLILLNAENEFLYFNF